MMQADQKPFDIRMLLLVMGHSLINSLVHLHCSLIPLPHTARFACALRCAHLFVRSLVCSLKYSLPSSWDRGIKGVNDILQSYRGEFCSSKDSIFSPLRVDAQHRPSTNLAFISMQCREKLTLRLFVPFTLFFYLERVL